MLTHEQSHPLIPNPNPNPLPPPPPGVQRGRETTARGARLAQAPLRRCAATPWASGPRWAPAGSSGAARCSCSAGRGEGWRRGSGKAARKATGEGRAGGARSFRPLRFCPYVLMTHHLSRIFPLCFPHVGQGFPEISTFPLYFRHVSPICPRIFPGCPSCLAVLNLPTAPQDLARFRQKDFLGKQILQDPDAICLSIAHINFSLPLYQTLQPGLGITTCPLNHHTWIASLPELWTFFFLGS